MATYSQHSAMATVVTYPTLANEHRSDPTADTDLYLMVFRRYGRLWDTTTAGCHNNGNTVFAAALTPPPSQSSVHQANARIRGRQEGVAMSHQSDTGVARTSLYEGSTQYRHWRFSPEQLAETRKTLNTAAVAAIRNAFEADSAGHLPLFFIRSQLSSSLARVVLTGFLSDCKRGELTSKALYRQGLPIMWPLSFSRGG
jgi:hypothetical protein